MRAVIFAAMAVALSACADSRAFYKEGATSADYKKTAYACERDTRAVSRSFGTSILAPLAARDFVVRCMESEGWEYR